MARAARPFAACLFLLACAAGPLHAAQADAAPPVERERIYGSELMTHAERERYRARMRGAKDDAGREKVREHHRKALQERARKRAGPSSGAPHEGRRP